MKHKGTEPVKTLRLLLRRFKLDDVYDMFKNYAKKLHGFYPFRPIKARRILSPM